MAYFDKNDLYEKGIDNVKKFLSANGMEYPRFYNRKLRSTGLYSYGKIYVYVDNTAHASKNYSWPSLFCDRTAYGVVAHEVGHYMDDNFIVNGRRISSVLKNVGEAPLTSYCPNRYEYTAEMMRLFITNPDLLKAIRPKVYKVLTEGFGLKVSEDRSYTEVLNSFNAPDEIFARVNKKLA